MIRVLRYVAALVLVLTGLAFLFPGEAAVAVIIGCLKLGLCTLTLI